MLLEKQLILFINIFHSSMRQCLAVVFLEKGYNLTPEQFLVMDTLWDEGILTQQQIAGILGISQVQVSRIEKKVLERRREKMMW